MFKILAQGCYCSEFSKLFKNNTLPDLGMRHGTSGFNYLMAGAIALRVPSTGDVQWVIPWLAY